MNIIVMNLIMFVNLFKSILNLKLPNFNSLNQLNRLNNQVFNRIVFYIYYVGKIIKYLCDKKNKFTTQATEKK